MKWLANQQRCVCFNVDAFSGSVLSQLVLPIALILMEGKSSHNVSIVKLKVFVLTTYTNPDAITYQVYD